MVRRKWTKRGLAVVVRRSVRAKDATVESSTSLGGERRRVEQGSWRVKARKSRSMYAPTCVLRAISTISAATRRCRVAESSHDGSVYVSDGAFESRKNRSQCQGENGRPSSTSSTLHPSHIASLAPPLIQSTPSTPAGTQSRPDSASPPLRPCTRSSTAVAQDSALYVSKHLRAHRGRGTYPRCWHHDPQLLRLRRSRSHVRLRHGEHLKSLNLVAITHQHPTQLLARPRRTFGTAAWKLTA